jgi:hypothetical protein
MRFYTKQHQYYCGIDLHTKNMYVCIVNQAGNTLYHYNLPARKDSLFLAIKPCLPNIMIALEPIFSCYWIAHFCALHHIPCVLGFALYMYQRHPSWEKLFMA